MKMLTSFILSMAMTSSFASYSESRDEVRLDFSHLDAQLATSKKQLCDYLEKNNYDFSANKLIKIKFSDHLVRANVLEREDLAFMGYFESYYNTNANNVDQCIKAQETAYSLFPDVSYSASQRNIDLENGTCTNYQLGNTSIINGNLNYIGVLQDINDQSYTHPIVSEHRFVRDEKNNTIPLTDIRNIIKTRGMLSHLPYSINKYDYIDFQGRFALSKDEKSIVNSKGKVFALSNGKFTDASNGKAYEVLKTKAVKINGAWRPILSHGAKDQVIIDRKVVEFTEQNGAQLLTRGNFTGKVNVSESLLTQFRENGRYKMTTERTSKTESLAIAYHNKCEGGFDCDVPYVRIVHIPLEGFVDASQGTLDKSACEGTDPLNVVLESTAMRGPYIYTQGSGDISDGVEIVIK